MCVSSKEQLQTGGWDDEDDDALGEGGEGNETKYSKWNKKVEEAKKDAKQVDGKDEDDEKAEAPMKKEDLPSELRKFISAHDRLAKAEAEADPVKSVEAVVARLKAQVTNASPNNDMVNVPPLKNVRPVPQTYRPVSLEEALGHLEVTAEKNSSLEPTKQVSTVVELAAARFVIKPIQPKPSN